MERSTQITLLLTGLALSCAGLGALLTAGGRYLQSAAAQSFTHDPDEVAAIAGEIADFELPPGYTGVEGWDQLGIALATFSAGVEDAPLPTLTVMRYPHIHSPEQALRQLTRSLELSGEGYVELSSRVMPIRGELVTVIRSQSSWSGHPLTHEAAAFPAGGGIGMAMASGDPEGWDQQLVDTFLLSIR